MFLKEHSSCALLERGLGNRQKNQRDWLNEQCNRDGGLGYASSDGAKVDLFGIF